jgi:hypothetical protein
MEKGVGTSLVALFLMHVSLLALALPGASLCGGGLFSRTCCRRGHRKQPTGGRHRATSRIKLIVRGKKGRGSLGERSGYKDMKQLVVAICGWRLSSWIIDGPWPTPALRRDNCCKCIDDVKSRLV